MNLTYHRVGRITLAVTLIGGGAVLIIDNLTNIGLFAYAARLWPAILIALGLEWIYVSRRTDPAQPSSIRLDGAAALCLVMAILFATSQPMRNMRNRAALVQSQAFPPVTRLEMRPVPPASPPSSAVLSGPVTSTEEPVVTDLQHLIVSGDQAAITVEPGEQLRITLQAQARGHDLTSAKLNAAKAGLEVFPGSVTRVGIALPRDVRFADLALRIAVPPGMRLTLHSTSGDIAVAGYRGMVNAQSTAGAIEVDQIDGPAELQTSSGSITARQVGGELSINTHSGLVDLADPSGKLDVRSTSGTIRVKTGQVGGEYSLQSSSGTVRLELPTTASVKVVARTKTGTIGGPEWLGPGSLPRTAAGTQGDGTYPVKIDTNSGAIRIVNL